jgi:hypothetical protein
MKNKEVRRPPVILTGTSPATFYKRLFPRYHCRCCSPGVELWCYDRQEIVAKRPSHEGKIIVTSMLLYQLILAAGLELFVYAGWRRLFRYSALFFLRGYLQCLESRNYRCQQWDMKMNTRTCIVIMTCVIYVVHLVWELVSIPSP